MNTLKTAIEYSKQGRIEEWVHMYLLGEGNNVEFSNGLKLEKRYFYGPVKMPLACFGRCCGPEITNRFVVEEKSFNSHVEDIKEYYESGWDMPPLIINYLKNTFELNDGNHRYEALVRANVTHYYVIVWTTTEEDMKNYIQSYCSE
jgi:hypothetical protein